MNRRWGALLIVGALAAMIPPGTAWSQAVEQDQVLLVPFSQRNTTLPHPAHEQAHITLKGIVRNATCPQGYTVTWDTDQDGDYDDEISANVSRDGTTESARDIGRLYKVPNVDRDTRMNINVRVRNRCTNQEKFGTYRLFVYDFTPSNDPRDWTAEQIEIMSLMAVQEALWYLHRTITSFSASDHTLYGVDQYEPTTPITLWLFTINGYLPAYPPQHVTAANFGNDLPAGWVAGNRDRWNAGPYGETAMRLANRIANSSNTEGLHAGEEDNTCGYDAQGRERTCNRIPGTGGDNIGASSVGGANTYRMGTNLGGIATVLPALAGTPLTRGSNSTRGQKWEWLIQQMADLMGSMQIDGGCSLGGWIYNHYNGSAGCGTSDGSTSQWAYIGLESAEIAGGPYGVFVNNRHKYRIAGNLLTNIRSDGGSGYRNNSGKGDVKLTGGLLVGSRWLGVHTFRENDGTTAFPGYVDRISNDGSVVDTYQNQIATRGRLKHAYNQYVDYLSRSWTERLSTGGHWQDSIWREGDYLCGDTNSVYNTNTGFYGGSRTDANAGLRCGSSYAMYSLQKGFRTGTPELEQVGNHDWVREFSIYYLRSQDRHASDNDPYGAAYGVTGRILDEYCDSHSVTCSYGSGRLAAPMGGLVLTPTIFTPKPVAIASVAPPVVTEGCAGGNNGRVVFDHHESFHPNQESRIIAYLWDVDADDGLWWNTNADPDGQIGIDLDGQPLSDTFEHTYGRNGVYTATLRVVDSVGQSKTTTVTVRVNEAQNVPPSAAHGGPYVIEVGQALELEGRGADVNTGCGDELTINWDLDNDGTFDDGNGHNPTIAWAAIEDLAVGQPNRIRIRVVDASGAAATAETTLTIYPQDPVAQGRVNPSPAACRVEVTFDGNASYHPNPQRTIAQYNWNVDGDDGNEGAGAIFRYAYDQYGTYQVTLQVVDDLGRPDETTFEVVVDQGNNPPVARVAENDIVVLEGDSLQLDGRGSSDPNENCGDSIVSYRWDINADGDFNDDVDVAGDRPIVPWDDLLAAGLRPADRDTGEPVYTLRLQVTDEFGAVGVAEVRVQLLIARPEAVVVQSPDPALIRRGDGRVTLSLDGRESRSPVPGVAIARFDWDLDDDGELETLNRPVVEFERIVPEAQRVLDNLPEYCVSLRVTDDTGPPGRESLPTRYCINLTVPPTPPTADADPTDPPEQAYHILLGDDVIVDGSQSFDPDDDDYIRWYRWDMTYAEADGFQPDVEREDENEDGEEARTELTAAQLADFGIDAIGVYPIRLQVEDAFGQSNVDDSTLTVHPRNPTARAVANPNPAACGARVTFDGSRSNHPHPRVEIQGYAWDFDGDGQYDDAQGVVATHRYDQFTFDGPIEAGLQVTDSNGNTASVTVPVRVDQGNRAPVAVAGGYRDGDGRVVGPYVIAVGDPLALDAAGSNDPDAACGDAIVSYEWFLNGDGAPDAQGPEVDLTWAQLNGVGIDRAGQYDVRLRVTDRFGVTAENVVTLRVVPGPDAAATASPDRTGCGNQVVFSGETSRAFGPPEQGFRIVSYEWDLDGDGQYDDAQGARVTRAAVGLPAGNGEIRITAGLRITDASGRTDTTTVDVVIDVQNLPPVADAGGPYVTGPLGNSWAPVRLDGRASSDPNAPCDQLVQYKWDTDNDGRYGADDNPDDLEGAVINGYINNAWRVNVVDQVRLIVCDTEGACSDPDVADITVLDEAPPAGNIVGPRADDPDVCVGQANFDVVVSISDPEGDFVTININIAGRQVATRRVQTNNDGSPVQVTLNVDPAAVPEGRHFIEAVFVDDNGAEATADSGGRITFDRTAPTVDIGDELGANVCYSPNQVPNPAIDVTDALDNAPELNEERLEDGCQRTLRVTAVDACGNEGVDERTYRLGVPVEVEIEGAAEGALLADARMSWDVVGPDACAGDITARLTRNNGQGQPYGENDLIEQPGAYALAVTVNNCQGVGRTQVRNFQINAPPEAVPIPAERVLPDEPLTYFAEEGSGLQVDGSESLPPELEDEIVEYRWDWNSDNNIDANGAVAAFPTDTDGRFQARLTVVDSLGATDTTDFTVVIGDVSPVADAGGPYVVPQGAELVFDGSGSRPGSADDAIREYRWDFGDGSDEVRGADAVQPRHTYDDNGTYIATLTVCDEDNCDTAEVRVEVRDVNPNVQGVDPDDPLFEIRPMSFQVNAEPGSPADPITRYEWEIVRGQGQDQEVIAEYAGADLDTMQHRFRDAGQYSIVVTVYDGDSETVEILPVEVAEITLAQLIGWIGDKVNQIGNAGGIPGNLAGPALGVLDAVEDGLWGERYDQRGSTLIAVDKIVTGLVALQAGGLDFGLELWAMSRQMLREMTRMRAVLLDNEAALISPDSIEEASDYIGDIRAQYGTLDEPSEEFEDDINGQQPFLVADLVADAAEAYYWLRDAIDPCNDYGDFPLTGNTPQQISENAVNTNVQLVQALQGLRAEMQAYADLGVQAGDTGPARTQVLAAIDAMDDILALAGFSVQNPCPDNQRCVTDIEALRLEIYAMELADALIAAQGIGAWSRNWQNCLVLAIKFRIELSILRVESVCGRFDATTQRARDVQLLGLNLVELGQNAAALEYYIDDRQQCFMHEILNTCLAPAINGRDAQNNPFPPNSPQDETPNVLYPDFCPQAGENGEGQPPGAVDMNNWVPPDLGR